MANPKGKTLTAHPRESDAASQARFREQTGLHKEGSAVPRPLRPRRTSSAAPASPLPTSAPRTPPNRAGFLLSTKR